jgi:hypothetical protein
MITDPGKKAAVAKAWRTVKRLCQGSHRQYATSHGFINETPLEAYYNLPFVLAYAVLDDVLDQLLVQGTIKCTPGMRTDPTTGAVIWMPGLKAKLEESLVSLTWQDYATIDRGRIARDALAHEAELLPKADCLGYVSAIEKELAAWGIL